jgi:hypothetical protein
VSRPSFSSSSLSFFHLLQLILQLTHPNDLPMNSFYFALHFSLYYFSPHSPKNLFVKFFLRNSINFPPGPPGDLGEFWEDFWISTDCALNDPTTIRYSISPLFLLENDRETTTFCDLKKPYSPFPQNLDQEETPGGCLFFGFRPPRTTPPHQSQHPRTGCKNNTKTREVLRKYKRKLNETEEKGKQEPTSQKRKPRDVNKRARSGNRKQKREVRLFRKSYVTGKRNTRRSKN